MTKSIYLMMMVVAAMLNAQELLPELAGPAAKHKAADEALDKQKTEAIAGATKPYLSALDGIEKTATAKGELEVVAAVAKEREAAVSVSLDPELPAALPKMKLQGTRKALLTKLEQLNNDFAKRKKQSAADYLRFLATLQTKAASNPELAKQLAAEKAALLAGGTDSGSSGTVVKVARGKNILVNGDFQKVIDGKPEGWKNLNGLVVETEGGNSFVRYDGVSVNNDDTAEYRVFIQEMAVPKGVKVVFVSARLRTKDCIRSKNPASYRTNPFFSLAFFDQNNKPVGYVAAGWEGKNGVWKTIQNTGTVPKDAVAFCITFTNGSRSGQVDFDDVEVTFK